uniref:Uncharacterized protein n=1 Tax=Romanomermis culicivorax TaxID=13658 RepID=A0A915JD69_ROMCU
MQATMQNDFGIMCTHLIWPKDIFTLSAVGAIVEGLIMAISLILQIEEFAKGFKNLKSRFLDRTTQTLVQPMHAAGLNARVKPARFGS